jgi:glycosyltransferase involved in cell wall biosynthesis
MKHPGEIKVDGAHSSYDIAIVLHDLRGGGAERAMLRLASGFHDAGRRVVLILVKAQGEYLQDVPATIPIVDLASGSVFGAIPKLASWIRRNKPGKILAALTHVNIAVIVASKFARFQGPVVVSERNQISEKAAAAQRVRERITYALTPFIYRRASAIVAVSRGVAQDVVKFTSLPDDRVHYVHNPVFNATIGEKAAQASPHPWLDDPPSDVPVIIAVGRLHHQKDFETLIRAFNHLRTTRPARLIIFGDGAERPTLERLAEHSPFSSDIDLPGFCANPFAAMSRAHLLVLSSRWEGFPNVLVEAMSCGCAVVATKCPSGPDEILDGGRYGPLVPIGDEVAMADAMAVALNTPGLGHLAAERAKVFSVASASENYLKILDQ